MHTCANNAIVRIWGWSNMGLNEVRLRTCPEPRTGLEALLSVSVRDLTVMADVGVRPEEIGRPQILRLHICLDVGHPVADDLATTIDYREVEKYAVALGQMRIGLIESFAQRLAERCLAHSSVIQADVTVEKPGALANGLATTRVVLRSQAAISF